MLTTLPQQGTRPGRSGVVRQAAPSTVLAVLLTLVLRVPFLGGLPYPDEGGLLLVARHWHDGGPTLYGHLFVDRPPLLLLFWRTADLLGGIEPARLLGCVAVAVLVVAAGWSGWLLGGHRGSRLAAVTAAALASTPIIGTHEIDAELLGAPLTMLGCACVLMASRHGSRSGTQAGWALLAGACGAGAVLMKQNLVDGLVFAAVLALVAGLTHAWPASKTARVLGFGVLGGLVPLSATALWAMTRGPGLDVLWFTLYGFRADAAVVVAKQSLAAPESRLAVLCVISVLSGMAVLLPAYLWWVRHRLRDRDPVAVAVVAMLAVEVVGVALGGSYWPHYLIAVIPGLALVVGSLATVPVRQPGRLRAGVSFVVVSSVAATLVSLSPYVVGLRAPEATMVQWLRAASHQSDTAMVTYGHADIIEAAGLDPGYRYLWSLPVRTLDPRLELLHRTLLGKSAPTWLLEWNSLDSWDIDPHGRLATAIALHYKRVGTICAIPVYLHRGISRTLPRPPERC